MEVLKFCRQVRTHDLQFLQDSSLHQRVNRKPLTRSKAFDWKLSGFFPASACLFFATGNLWNSITFFCIFRKRSIKQFFFWCLHQNHSCLMFSRRVSKPKLFWFPGSFSLQNSGLDSIQPSIFQEIQSCRKQICYQIFYSDSGIIISIDRSVSKKWQQFWCILNFKYVFLCNNRFKLYQQGRSRKFHKLARRSV